MVSRAVLLLKEHDMSRYSCGNHSRNRGGTKRPPVAAIKVTPLSIAVIKKEDLKHILSQFNRDDKQIAEYLGKSKREARRIRQTVGA